MEYRITAVDRDRAFEHEAISAIGNTEEQWSISVQSAILRIQRGIDKFFVEDALSGELVYLDVFQPETGPLQIRAKQGGRWTNHLLPLPSLRNCTRID